MAIDQKHIKPGRSYNQAESVSVWANEAITTGDILQPMGRNGPYILVRKALATSITASSGRLLVAHHDISADQHGRAYPWKMIGGGDWSAGSVGATVYLSNTGAPSLTPGTFAVPIGTVLEADSSGAYLFSPDQGAIPATTSGASAPTAAGSGVVASSSIGQLERVVLTLTDVAIPLTDEAGVVAYGGLKVLDFPEGQIAIVGAQLDVDVTKSSAGVNDDWNGDIAVGSATAGNNANLNSTEANIIPSTATPPASSGATTGNAQSTGFTVLDGTSTAVDVYINALVDDANHDVTSTPCNLILNGTLDILYSVIGDY